MPLIQSKSAFRRPALALGLVGFVAGCSAATPLSLSPPNPGAGTPSVTSSLTALLPKGDTIAGSPTEVYTRVAHGVLTCWFGAAGPLKSAYIYHADAEPASKGGQSEIQIFIRDPTASDPRSQRAYRVLITPSGSTTKVETENVKIPEPLASRLTADVTRWSAEEGGCGDSAVTAGWAAEQRPPTPDKQAKKKK